MIIELRSKLSNKKNGNENNTRSIPVDAESTRIRTYLA
jgi:hypothetical protein